VRIPVAAKTESSASAEFHLKKRVSPADYHDGFMAGLQCARDAIQASLDNYRVTKTLFEAGSDPTSQG
jgi:hypothetical protein